MIYLNPKELPKTKTFPLSLMGDTFWTVKKIPVNLWPVEIHSSTLDYINEIPKPRLNVSSISFFLHFFWLETRHGWFPPSFLTMNVTCKTKQP